MVARYKTTRKTWDEVKILLKKAFAPQKPTYKLYQEIFSTKQNSGEPTDAFIFKKRALFSQIPAPNPSEQMQLDMIFGMLDFEIRSESRREETANFDELISKVRTVENLQAEKTTTAATTKNKHFNKTFIRCGYCGYKGHAEEQCRKKKKQTYLEKAANENKSKPLF